jgi:hypothetical protein
LSFRPQPAVFRTPTRGRAAYLGSTSIMTLR